MIENRCGITLNHVCSRADGDRAASTKKLYEAAMAARVPFQYYSRWIEKQLDPNFRKRGAVWMLLLCHAALHALCRSGHTSYVDSSLYGLVASAGRGRQVDH